MCPSTIPVLFVPNYFDIPWSKIEINLVQFEFSSTKSTVISVWMFTDMISIYTHCLNLYTRSTWGIMHCI